MHIPEAFSLDQNNATLSGVEFSDNYFHVEHIPGVRRQEMGCEPKTLNGWKWHWWHWYQQSNARWQSAKLCGLPSDFFGDKREWRHFEWVFRNWYGFLHDTTEEWLDQAANAPGELGEALPGSQRDGQRVVHEFGHFVQERALSHKRGFQSGRKLSKEYGTTTGTSLTTLNHRWIQEETVEMGKSDCWLPVGDRGSVQWQESAFVLSRFPAPIRTYLRLQNRGALRVALMNYLEAEDDGHGPVPMEVGVMKGKKGDRGKKGWQRKVWESSTKGTSTAKTTITAKTVRKEKKEEKQRKRTKKRRETNVKLEFPRLLQVMWQMMTQDEWGIRASC